jgi:hypothetical protein
MPARPTRPEPRPADAGIQGLSGTLIGQKYRVDALDLGEYKAAIAAVAQR